MPENRLQNLHAFKLAVLQQREDDRRSKDEIDHLKYLFRIINHSSPTRIIATLRQEGIYLNKEEAELLYNSARRKEFSYRNERELARRLRDELFFSEQKIVDFMSPLGLQSPLVRKNVRTVLEVEREGVNAKLQNLVRAYRRGMSVEEQRRLQAQIKRYILREKRYRPSSTIKTAGGREIPVSSATFDQFIDHYQRGIFDLVEQMSPEMGIANQEVWKREYDKKIRNYVYAFGLLQSGGVNNIDWETADRLARIVKTERKKVEILLGMLTGNQVSLRDFKNYAASVPVRILLDDLRIELLSEVPGPVAYAINKAARIAADEVLDARRGRNRSFFKYAYEVGLSTAIDYPLSTVSQSLQERFYKYITEQTLNAPASQLRESQNWRRYYYDPYIKRYRAAFSTGQSYAAVLLEINKKQDESAYLQALFGTKNINGLTTEQQERWGRILEFADEYKAQLQGRKEGTFAGEPNEVRQSFVKYLTQEERARINPGIPIEDPRTGEPFFAGRFIRAEMLISDEDTLTYNRLMVALRQEELMEAGRLDIVQNLNTVADFEFGVAQKLKKYHILSYLLGAGINPTDLTQRDYNRLERDLRTQYRYLRDLSYDLIQGNKLTESRFLARIAQYGVTTGLSYFQGQFSAHIRKFFAPGRWQKRKLNGTENCSGCVDKAAEGWLPIGKVTPLGQGTPCRSNCDCEMLYSDSLSPPDT